MKKKQPSKHCYRCDNVVRMTEAEFYYGNGPFAAATCCDVCLDKLRIEAEASLQPISREELKPPAPWRMSAWDSEFPAAAAPAVATT